MLRLIGFFVLAALLASVLGHVPFIGPVFRHTGVFGILIAATLLSALGTRMGERIYQGRKLQSELRALGAVESPHNQGKLGMLYLARGRARAALTPLATAVAGEPGVAEWPYRLGLARLAVGDASGALEALERCVAIEPEHAYGQAQMRRVECLQRLGRSSEALAALEVFERNHGPSAESAFRRGRSLRKLGRASDARMAFQAVEELARQATRYQKRAAAWWSFRASLARFF